MRSCCGRRDTDDKENSEHSDYAVVSVNIQIMSKVVLNNRIIYLHDLVDTMNIAN